MPAPRSIRLRVSLELLDERGQPVIAAPSETFVQGSRLAEIEAMMVRGQIAPLDGDNNAVAQQAFNLCRDSYCRIVAALTTKGEAT